MAVSAAVNHFLEPDKAELQQTVNIRFVTAAEKRNLREDTG
jgi:hypothetical protein